MLNRQVRRLRNFEIFPDMRRDFMIITFAKFRIVKSLVHLSCQQYLTLVTAAKFSRVDNFSRSAAIPIERGLARLANQNPRLSSHMPSQSHLTWHSGTKVVGSAH
jgi:hypothetical protein